MREVTRVRRTCALDSVCLSLTACVAVLALACSPVPSYRVSLRIEDGALVRTLALLPQEKADGSTEKTELPEAQASALGKLYGQPAADGSYTARFSPELATDLGGSATLGHAASLLGTVYTYRERIQGADRPLEFASDVQSAVASARALSDGWLAVELSAHPDAGAALDAWLRERVIPDAGNFLLYGWLTSSGLLNAAETKERLAHFAIEHGYLEARDLPPLDDLEELWPLLIRRALQQKGVTLDAELETELAALVPGEALLGSLGAHIVRSGAFRRWRERSAPDARPISEDAIAAALADEDTAEAKAVGELFNAYLEQEHAALMETVGYLFVPATSRGRIELTLALAEPPLETNGTWEAETGQVRWKDLSMQTEQISSFAYASWSEPAHEYQAPALRPHPARGAASGRLHRMASLAGRRRAPDLGRADRAPAPRRRPARAHRGAPASRACAGVERRSGRESGPARRRAAARGARSRRRPGALISRADRRARCAPRERASGDRTAWGAASSCTARPAASSPRCSPTPARS